MSFESCALKYAMWDVGIKELLKATFFLNILKGKYDISKIKGVFFLSPYVSKFIILELLSF